MLVLDGVSKQFGRTRAVDGVSRRIPRGQFVGVIGRSGAGKSTLLRMINRLERPDLRADRLGRRDVTALRGRALRDWRRRCAMIFQQFNLVGRLDVLDNVLMGRLAHTPTAGARMAKLWSRDDRAIAMAALDQMDIAGLAPQRAESLVGRPAAAGGDLPRPGAGARDRAGRRAGGLARPAQLAHRHGRAAAHQPAFRPDRAVQPALARPRPQLLRPAGRHGRRPVVFDDVPAALTDAVARELYGLEANEVLERDEAPVPDSAPGRRGLRPPSSSNLEVTP